VSVPAFAAALAVTHPSQIALRDHRQTLGWAQVDEVMNRVANGLGPTVALGSSRRVAVFAENAAETALAHMGGLLGGASTVPVNFHLTADEASYILADSESRVVFVGPETAVRGVEAARAAGIAMVIGWHIEADHPAFNAVTHWNDWLAGQSSEELPLTIVPRPNLLYTSGTTGRPKGTELPPTMFAGGPTMVEHLAQLQTNRFAKYGTHLVVGPMYHTGPLSGARLLVAGICSVILPRFDAEATLAAIERYNVETSVMVPTHFSRLLALSPEVKERYDISSVKVIGHTGAKCPVDVKRAMINWWGPVFFDSYGATETGTTCSINSEEWLKFPGSVGRAIAPFAVKVLDDDGGEVAPGVEGLLCFADSTGRGIVYPNDPEKTALANLAPGLFTLGEVGYVNDEGYVYITDRVSDMVVSGGVNIYPAEAEQVLVTHPGVADVACIGVPNADLGEEMKGLVILKSDLPEEAVPSADELLTFCRARLSVFKCPRTIEFVNDIGRNTMGKVNKRSLRAPYWTSIG
jgi:long-chain acyl-CoA synthetase